MSDLQQTAAGAAPHLCTLAERFRPLLDSDDLLTIEETTAELIAQAKDEDDTLGLELSLGVVALAACRPEPQVAALVCALDAFMSGMAVRMALSNLIHDNVPKPRWHNHLGDVVPGPIWRYLDCYGEQRAILATFYYGETPHTLITTTRPWPTIHIQAIQLLRSADDELRQSTIQNIEQSYGGPVVEEPLTPQELRDNLMPAISFVSDDFTNESRVAMEILRQRLETLPSPSEFPDSQQMAKAQSPQLTQPDDDIRMRESRDAAVEAFLSATATTAGVDDAVLRFWARVMTGTTAVRSVPPTYVSLDWIDYLLKQYVPQMIEIPESARAGLRPAVTAWVCWAAAQRGLPSEVLTALTARIVELDEAFDQVYDDPIMIANRCYLWDVVTTTVDSVHLRRVLHLRVVAVPTPDVRSAEYRHLLASDPDHREQILADTLASWQLPPEDEQQWSDALHRVSTRLWNIESSEFITAISDCLLREGHDSLLLGELTELAVQYASDEQAFVSAVIRAVTSAEDDFEDDFEDDCEDDFEDDFEDDDE